MRTTVTIADELLAAAKRRARERGQTLGDVVDAALRRELSDTGALTDRPGTGVPGRHRPAAGDRHHVEPIPARSPRRQATCAQPLHLLIARSATGAPAAD